MNKASATTLLCGLLAMAPGTAFASCGDGVLWCFPIRLVMARSGDVEADKVWLKAQLDRANSAFSGAGVGFYVRQKGELTGTQAFIDDANQRDRAGRKLVRRGEILVLSPLRLLDVPDKTRQRHGVHWRDRKDRRGEDRRRRWLVVVNGARRPEWSLPIVLAHELGHFFGLPHSRYAGSLMNKAPGDDRPPMAQWRLVDAELKIVARRARQMVRVGRLRVQAAR